MLCPSCQAPNEDDAGECFTCGRALSGVAPIKQGDTIGARYVIRARLGRGGMGTVYRAYDCALEEDVALKVMTADATVDPELARRFRSGGPLPPAEAYDVAMQVTAGLEAIHEAGIVHRVDQQRGLHDDHIGAQRIYLSGILRF